MVTWRFTLIGLFSTVAIVAVACAALASPSPAWTTVVVTATLAMLSIAVLGAIFRRSARRAFWIGFATIGCGYTYFIAHDKLGDSTFAPFDDAGPPLATTKLLNRLGDKLYGNLGAAGYGAAPVSGYYSAAPVSGYAVPYQSSPVSAVPDEADISLENPSITSTALDSDRYPKFADSTPSDANPQLADVDPATDEAMPVAYDIPNPPVSGRYSATMYVPSVDPLRGQRFLRIGQYLWALLLGLLGGVVARWMYASAERGGGQLPTKAG